MARGSVNAALQEPVASTLMSRTLKACSRWGELNAGGWRVAGLGDRTLQHDEASEGSGGDFQRAGSATAILI